MESVTIKNAENKLEACSGKRKIHDRSKAVVANVSLGAMGGRRRLALLDKFHVGQRVQLADRKHPTSRYPQGQRVKGDYGILSKKLAKKHKYLPQKWIPAGAKGTVKKVASATRGYSTAEDSALAVWVVFDDIKTFTPGKKITTMAPVRIENAPNKLEACTTTAPAYALPSNAVVTDVSLGGRRRLAPTPVQCKTCETLQADRKCGNCKQAWKSLRCCPRCHKVSYCSVNCQKAAWKDHRNVCKTDTSVKCPNVECPKLCSRIGGCNRIWADPQDCKHYFHNEIPSPECDAVCAYKRGEGQYAAYCVHGDGIVAKGDTYCNSCLDGATSSPDDMSDW